MRIDAHTHGMHAERNEKGILVPPLTPCEYGKEPQEQLEKECYAYGIEGALLLDPPHVAFAHKERMGSFIIPVPQVDLDKTTTDEIQKLFDRGAAGIKFIAPMKSYGSNDYFPFYDVVDKNHKLAVFHTGFLGATGLFAPGAVLAREDIIDITNMRPAAIDRIARKFPDLKILMAHFGNPWWEEARTVIASYKNVYSDFSGGTAAKRDMGMWKMIFAPNGVRDDKTLSKLCFGTDGTALIPGCYKDDFVIKFYDNFYDSLDVPQSIRTLIDHDNILNLLR